MIVEGLGNQGSGDRGKLVQGFRVWGRFSLRLGRRKLCRAATCSLAGSSASHRARTPQVPTI